MAKKDEDEILDDELDYDEEDGAKKGNKVMTALIAVFIVVIWIAIFALLIKLDVGGFGSSVMAPILKNVPVINKILPDTEAGMESENGDTYSTLQDAIDRINQLESEIRVYRDNADNNAETISNLQAEVKRLMAYEVNQTYFEQLKKKFDEEVVYTENAPDIDTYKSWYEEMYPENAEDIYRQVIEQLEQDQVIKDLASYYSSMKPAAAAKIFEEMTGDLEKVAHILSSMKPASAAEILGAMDSVIAAKLTLLIYPADEHPLPSR